VSKAAADFRLSVDKTGRLVADCRSQTARTAGYFSIVGRQSPERRPDFRLQIENRPNGGLFPDCRSTIARKAAVEAAFHGQACLTAAVQHPRFRPLEPAAARR